MTDHFTYADRNVEITAHGEPAIVHDKNSAKYYAISVTSLPSSGIQWVPYVQRASDRVLIAYFAFLVAMLFAECVYFFHGALTASGPLALWVAKMFAMNILPFLKSDMQKVLLTLMSVPNVKGWRRANSVLRVVHLISLKC